MKKLLFLCFALCAAFVASAQNVPYSKYLNYSKDEFKDNHFKYDKKTNTWTPNILAIIADAKGKKKQCVDDLM